MKKQIVLHHQLKYLSHPYLKTYLHIPLIKFKYQLDNLDIHIKHTCDSPASPDPEIDLVHIKETTESLVSLDSTVTMQSVYEKTHLWILGQALWHLSKN